MACLAVEAILNFSSLQAELIATGLASAVKMSDFVSDFFFIKDLINLQRNHHNNLAEEEDDASNSNERRRKLLLLEQDRLQLSLRRRGQRRFLQKRGGYSFDYDEYEGGDGGGEGDDYYYYNDDGDFAAYASSQQQQQQQRQQPQYERWLPIRTYIALASLFTGLGILFDLVMTYITIQDHRAKKALKAEEEKPVSEVLWEQGITSGQFWNKISNTFFESDASKHEEHWVWWRHLNIIIEEIPQLVLLILFYVDWSRLYLQSKDELDGDTKEYWEKTKASIFVSAAITSFLLIKITIGYLLYQKSKRHLLLQNKIGIFSSAVAHNDESKKTKKKSISKERTTKTLTTTIPTKVADGKRKRTNNDSSSSGFFLKSKSTDTTAASSDGGGGIRLFSRLKEEEYTKTKKKSTPKTNTTAKQENTSTSKSTKSQKDRPTQTAATATAAIGNSKNKNNQSATISLIRTNSKPPQQEQKKTNSGSSSRQIGSSSLTSSIPWVTTSTRKGDDAIVSSPLCCGFGV